MQCLIMVIHYEDDVEIDPILIEDFIKDNYKTVNIDAAIHIDNNFELSFIKQREQAQEN